LFSIIVKQKTFTKHRRCQRAAPILCIKRSYCCAAAITLNICGQSDDRPRKPICLVNSAFGFPPPSTQQRLPGAKASARFTERVVDELLEMVGARGLRIGALVASRGLFESLRKLRSLSEWLPTHGQAVILAPP
jgi:hypothetical protein